jgi:tetratricopeptide (TPR) repeat protein
MLVREAHATALQAKLAETGDGHSAEQVERLLSESERACAQGATDRDPLWVGRFDAVELSGQAACCWGLLNEHQRALTCAETAIHGYGERFSRAVQLSQVNAAEAYLGMGELEQALDSARAAIPMTKALTSARSVERLQKFAGQLEPYGDSVMVREFRDHLNHELAA